MVSVSCSSLSALSCAITCFERFQTDPSLCLCCPFQAMVPVLARDSASGLSSRDASCIKSIFHAYQMSPYFQQPGFFELCALAKTHSTEPPAFEHRKSRCRWTRPFCYLISWRVMLLLNPISKEPLLTGTQSQYFSLSFIIFGFSNELNNKLCFNTILFYFL